MLFPIIITLLNLIKVTCKLDPNGFLEELGPIEDALDSIQLKKLAVSNNYNPTQIK